VDEACGAPGGGRVAGIMRGTCRRGNSGMRRNDNDDDNDKEVGESTIELLCRFALCGKSPVFGSGCDRRANRRVADDDAVLLSDSDDGPVRFSSCSIKPSSSSDPSSP